MEELRKKDLKICSRIPLFLGYLIAGSIYFLQENIEKSKNDDGNILKSIIIVAYIQISIMSLLFLQQIFYYFFYVYKFDFNQENRKSYQIHNLLVVISTMILGLSHAWVDNINSYGSALIFYSMYYFIMTLVMKRYLQYGRYKDYVIIGFIKV